MSVSQTVVCISFVSAVLWSGPR